MIYILAGLIAITIWEVIKHMRKVHKNYRLSYHTLDKLDILKNLIPGQTETAIVEAAICDYCDQILTREGQHIEATRTKVQLIQINNGVTGRRA